MRIGQGVDAHKFGEGDHVMLGGIRIPHDHGLLAHSDGDVLIHALIDALLGAAGMGDIGSLFPDTDQSFENVDSRELLRDVVRRLSTSELRITNVDMTVIAQVPRMSPHIEAIRKTLAADLRIDPGRVNVKATTTEKMGFTGRGEGIAAMAVALLHEIDTD
ncbi:MAG: 2-C-methyl-D-erythritol 2,4-cyclodiphosphate synthase [bacterium]